MAVIKIFITLSFLVYGAGFGLLFSADLTARLKNKYRPLRWRGFFRETVLALVWPVAMALGVIVLFYQARTLAKREKKPGLTYDGLLAHNAKTWTPTLDPTARGARNLTQADIDRLRDHIDQEVTNELYRDGK